MKPKRAKRSCFFFWFILAIGLILCGMGYNLIMQYPSQAEQIYGKPSIHLTSWQKYVLSYRLVKNQNLLLGSSGPETEIVQFTIEISQPTDSIISNLADDGLIWSAPMMRDLLIYSGLDTQLQAGDYRLNKGMSAVEIAQTLLDSTPMVVKVSILPGWRLEEIADSLPSTGVSITPEEFLRAANQKFKDSPLISQVPAAATLEGFFPPGTYEVERTINADQLVEYLVRQFELSIPPKTLQGIEQQGLSFYQGLTLASIIQREAVINDEMPVIASVFYNRIAISMKLETDPTVQYAIGYNPETNTWWTNPLTYTHLEVESPYNTYRYNGLPPTPISNPSLTALQAVAFPAQTPYYFFRAACDGSGRHNFSETFDQHLNFACP